MRHFACRLICKKRDTSTSLRAGSGAPRVEGSIFNPSKSHSGQSEAESRNLRRVPQVSPLRPGCQDYIHRECAAKGGEGIIFFRRSHPQRSGVILRSVTTKNPENFGSILAAGILWILHCVRSHGDRPSLRMTLSSGMDFLQSWVLGFSPHSSQTMA